jgi:uncharacterized membrane protein
MNLESCRNYGGIGAILLIVGSLSSFGVGPYGGILDLAGIILVLVAMHGLAGYYNERGIFSNAIYAIITSVVGAAVVVAAGVVTFFSFLNSIGFDTNNVTNATYLQNFFTNFDWSTKWSTIWGYVGVFIALWIVFIIFIAVAAFLFRRSLNMLSSKTEVGMFGTAGWLMLIGAILAVIGVGLIIIWIGWILLAVAFFSMKTQGSQPVQSTQNVPPPISPS